MTLCAGILLDQHVLQNSIRGEKTFERVDVYAAVAAKLGIQVLLFSPSDLHLKRRRVAGFIPLEGGGWKRVTAPIPRVVHKRGLFLREREIRIVRRLERLGIYVFNPEIPWDKYHIHRLLAAEPRLRDHLPPTVALKRDRYDWFRQKLTSAGEVFVKPRRGSLGLGIVRVMRVGAGRYLVESEKTRRLTTLRGSWKRIRKVSKTPRLLQVGVPLLEDEGKRVDFRVPVQLDAEGYWRIAGIAAKRAERSRFLTNLARGGSVHPASAILVRHFGMRKSAAVFAAVEYVARVAAEVVNRRYPRMVDFGVDVGVDREGHPFVIEVNRRDLRVLLERSGQIEANERLFATPLEYACAVLRGSIPTPRPVGESPRRPSLR